MDRTRQAKIAALRWKASSRADRDRFRAFAGTEEVKFLPYEEMISVGRRVWENLYYPASVAGTSDEVSLDDLRRLIVGFGKATEQGDGWTCILSPKIGSVIPAVRASRFHALADRVFYCLGPTLAVCTLDLKRGVASMTDTELGHTDVVVW